MDIQFTEQHKLAQPAAAAPTRVAERAKASEPAAVHEPTTVNEPTLMAQLAKAAGVRLGHVWGVVIASALIALVAFGLIVRSILADRPAAEVAVQAAGSAPPDPSPTARPAAPAPARPAQDARRPVDLAVAPAPTVGLGRPPDPRPPQPRPAETAKAPAPVPPAARAAEPVPAERKKAKVAPPAAPAPAVVVKPGPVKAPPPPPVERAARPGLGAVAAAAPAPPAPAPALAPGPAPDPAPVPAPPEVKPAAGRVLAPAAVQGAIARGKPAFDKCVETALASPGGDALAGRRIALLVAVGNAGTVEASEVEELDVEASPLGACLRRAAGRLAFPPFDGEVVGVRVPLQVGAVRPVR